MKDVWVGPQEKERERERETRQQAKEEICKTKKGPAAFWVFFFKETRHAQQGGGGLPSFVSCFPPTPHEHPSLVRLFANTAGYITVQIALPSVSV